MVTKKKLYKVNDPRLTRFLKEMNAFHLWEKYVNFDVDGFFAKLRKDSEGKELKYNALDSIFGRCSFTDYLKANGYSDLLIGEEELVSDLFRWFVYFVFQDYMLSENGKQFAYLTDYDLTPFILEIIKRCGINSKNIKWLEIQDMIDGHKQLLNKGKWPTKS